ncbi:MAG: VCBS repeat-containing protein [Candidatus Eisenbacteria bacterium]|uniref:VCBS repeat-containing protein n=1 Tax=Eiseniibacteriota bacterium TaxID=2212470 RepID=A0A538TW37_UNCEI|nr:MAG: VCBS repeat-containing protein [Candidatus Eisenbacteria bacterium]
MQTYYITRGRLIPILGAGILSCVLYTPASAMCPGPNFFAAATSYPTGANPTYVATGDFNGDGKADLVVADSYVSSGGAGSAIAVLLGHGNGSFDAPVLYPCVSRPRSIATGDFNGDAITDLAVTNQGAPYVSVFLGLGSGGVGNGTFASAVAYAAGAGPFHIRAADLNQDGITDLVVSNNSVAAVTVLVGEGKGGVGDGTFAAPVSYPLNNLSTGLAVADFDSDGILDLVATENYSGTIALLRGHGSGGVGDGTFAHAVHIAAGPEPFDITVHDFDGDGIADVAVANTSSGGIAIMRGNGTGGHGDGTFLAPSVLSSGNSAQAVPADVDQDGITDLIVTVAAAPGSIVVYRGQGTGLANAAEFAQPTTYPVGGDPIQTALVDLNGDTKPDLAVPNYFDDFISVLLAACVQDPRAPVLTAVRDVPHDQGGKVFVTWTRSSLDVQGGPVLNYRVWRRIPPGMIVDARAHRSGSRVPWTARWGPRSSTGRRSPRCPRSGFRAMGTRRRPPRIRSPRATRTPPSSSRRSPTTSTCSIRPTWTAATRWTTSHRSAPATSSAR